MKLEVIKHMLVMFVVNHLCDGAYLFEVKRRLLNLIGYSLGEGTKVVGPIYCTAKLKTGSNCWLGRNFTIHGNGTVLMGDNCDIAKDVTFLTGRHETGTQESEAGEEEVYSVCVGEGCWIGAHATLGRNVTIGTGCMVLADACVLKNMPENTLIGGVPARIVRKLNEVESY
jgi:maltose O-acetyltransferase